MIQGRPYSTHKQHPVISHKQINSLDKSASRKAPNGQLRYQKVLPSSFGKPNSSFLKLYQQEKGLHRMVEAQIEESDRLARGRQGVSPGREGGQEARIRESLEEFSGRLLRLGPRVEEYAAQVRKSQEEWTRSHAQARQVIGVAYSQLLAEVQRAQSEQLAQLDQDQKRGSDVFTTLQTRLAQSARQLSDMKDDVLYDVDAISRQISSQQYNQVMAKYDQQIECLQALFLSLDRHPLQLPSAKPQPLQVVPPVALSSISRPLLESQAQQQHSFTNFIKQQYSKSKTMHTQPDHSFTEERSAKKLWRLGNNDETPKQKRFQREGRSPEMMVRQEKSPEASLGGSLVESLLKSSQSANKIKGLLDKVQASQTKNDEYFSEIESRHIHVIKEFEVHKEQVRSMKCDEQLENSVSQNQKLFPFQRDDVSPDGKDKSLFCSPTFKEF